jgi:hypothetical protein
MGGAELFALVVLFDFDCAIVTDYFSDSEHLPRSYFVMTAVNLQKEAKSQLLLLHSYYSFCVVIIFSGIHTDRRSLSNKRVIKTRIAIHY